jgi:hypothetical protein
MDGTRLDGLSRSLARRSSRRNALKMVSSAGLAGAIAVGSAAELVRSAAAQSTPAAGDGPVILPFSAEVRQGPSAGTALKGFLTLPRIESGTIDHAVLIPINDDNTLGQTIPVSGQVNGRAISLLFVIGDSAYLYGTGTMSAPLTDAPTMGDDGKLSAPFAMGGPFVGPNGGDTGDWIIDILIGVAVAAGAALLAPFGCFANCSYSGGTDANCDKACGTNHGGGNS